jgi:hypothetical protein
MISCWLPSLCSWGSFAQLFDGGLVRQSLLELLKMLGELGVGQGRGAGSRRREELQPGIAIDQVERLGAQDLHHAVHQRRVELHERLPVLLIDVIDVAPGFVLGGLRGLGILASKIDPGRHVAQRHIPCAKANRRGPASRDAPEQHGRDHA